MTHVPEVMGSNPGAVYWMDMTFFIFICCKNCIVSLKRPKINEKEARIGPFSIFLQYKNDSTLKFIDKSPFINKIFLSLG